MVSVKYANIATTYRAVITIPITRPIKPNFERDFVRPIIENPIPVPPSISPMIIKGLSKKKTAGQ